MRNFALTTDGRPPREVERALHHLLPQLDVRLWPYGARQAIIPAPLLRALDSGCPGGAGPLLRRLGVEEMRPLSDEATLELLAGRDALQLSPRDAGPPLGTPDALDAHLQQLRIAPAWDRLGGPERIDWTGVRVGQIDTGYTPHPALGFPGHSWVDAEGAASFVERPGTGESSLLAPEPGAGLDSLGAASRGHGTRIASVLCGHDPNANGGRFLGAAPRVPLVPVRIADVTWVNHAQRELAQALRHLVDEARVQVVCIGLGIFGATVRREVREAVSHAIERGVILVCAAGNHVNGIVAPARLPGTVAVGGVTQGDRPWSGSGFGRRVDVSAPATGVRRAVTHAAGDYDYGPDGDGSCYAAALTAGVAALWVAHHRLQLDACYPEPWQQPVAFAALLAATARRPAAGWPAEGYGAGVVDAAALLAATLPPAALLARAAAA